MAIYTGPGQSSSYESSYYTIGSDLGERSMTRDLVEYLREYAREKPEVAALWCLGIGFILGWKLKPW